mgnify:CR=1 FL=1
MSEINEQSPAGETQPPAEEKTDAMRIELLEAKNRQLINEKQSVNEKMKGMERKLQELQTGAQKQKQENLVKNQEFEQLWKDASQSNSSLQEQLAEKDRAIEEMKLKFQQEQIKASATNLFAQSGVNAPDHLMKILGENLRLDENGAVVILTGGVQVPLNQHIQNLKTPGSGFEMFFTGSGARGMSAVGSTSNAAGQNSWESMSFSERLALEVQDPEAAARLKAQG